MKTIEFTVLLTNDTNEHTCQKIRAYGYLYAVKKISEMEGTIKNWTRAYIFSYLADIEVSRKNYERWLKTGDQYNTVDWLEVH